MKYIIPLKNWALGAILGLTYYFLAGPDYTLLGFFVVMLLGQMAMTLNDILTELGE